MDQYADAGAASTLHTAPHEAEDLKLPHRTRAAAKEKLASFLKEETHRAPELGYDLLEEYRERKLGLPG